MFGIQLLGLAHILLVIVFGISTLWIAGSFAFHPHEKKLGLVKPASAATAFAVLSAVCAGLATTFSNVATEVVSMQVPGSRVMAGLAESLVPAVMGFALLALAWMFVFIGLRRLG